MGLFSKKEKKEICLEDFPELLKLIEEDKWQEALDQVKMVVPHGWNDFFADCSKLKDDIYYKFINKYRCFDEIVNKGYGLLIKSILSKIIDEFENDWGFYKANIDVTREIDVTKLKERLEYMDGKTPKSGKNLFLNLFENLGDIQINAEDIKGIIDAYNDALITEIDFLGANRSNILFDQSLYGNTFAKDFVSKLKMKIYENEENGN